MTNVLYFEPLAQEDINVGVGTTTKRNPAGGVLAATQVGIHTLGVGQIGITQTWDPASINALGTASVTVSYPGAAIGDFTLRSFSVTLQGLILFAEVTATNVVTVTLFNPTTSAVDLGSGTLKILVLKSR